MTAIVQTLRQLPSNMIDGPARVLIQMDGDVVYTTTELAKKTSLANSTVARHLTKLVEIGVVRIVRLLNERGRPKHYYTLVNNS